MTEPVSMMDTLADMVSKKIGCEVIVLRQYGPRSSRRRVMIEGYSILVRNDKYHFNSGRCNANEVKKYLALLADWIAMGFIKLEKSDD